MAVDAAIIGEEGRSGAGVAQLPTPALSPIDEHDENRENRCDGLDAKLIGHTQSHGSESVPPANGILENGNGQSQDTSKKVVDTPELPPKDVQNENAKALKLSPRQLDDLVTSPESLPVRPVSQTLEDIPDLANGLEINGVPHSLQPPSTLPDSATKASTSESAADVGLHGKIGLSSVEATPGALTGTRPRNPTRSASSPLMPRKQSTPKVNKHKPDLPLLRTADEDGHASRHSAKPSPKPDTLYSPMPALLPVPPMSLPTYLQLELAPDRPSALYIHRSTANELPYESSQAKFVRLLNFLLLPPNLEQVLCFGTVACLDAWLFTFTILPLRFLKALTVLIQWWLRTSLREVQYLASFVYSGLGRVWQRRRQSSVSDSRRPSLVTDEGSRRPSIPSLNSHAAPRLDGHASFSDVNTKGRKSGTGFRHRRSRSVPSALLPDHKADLLQGLLIAASCFFLMWFDASRMYHSIRGQSAIKLYVIYNVLEVFDRLFSALGQDILECLFSKETLERNENGRSKIIRPLWLWTLALIYTVLHSTALFYQVVTLNVAVNSYSNALLTLLMSNQFVEIKGTVFKKIEKENLFQLTCADIVERFQLWLMLLIIALRNVVELGGLGISMTGGFGGAATSTGSLGGNATGLPLTSGFAIPRAFTLLPKWSGELLGPFLIVLGSEALVDWCKHAYIGKFNNTKPNIYNRFLDVLAKDYYTHAFSDQNLTKRLGLPVIPLSCLFIRACVQTYHMFLATHVPPPIPSMATAVSLENEASSTSPATTAALQHIDRIFRHALGRSTFGAGSQSASTFSWWSLDDVIALATMLTFFLALYLVLLAFKLLLGMLLLTYARKRYQGMKERERQVTSIADGKRAGVGAMTEVDESKREWIYADDADGLKAMREKEQRGRKQSREKGDKLENVDRYTMAAKRIW
ncbi:hypothetical protein LTR78_006227 [Recurvomyces mirabilis]|uniref:DUF747-domain-containing protein n=1 Tax=Recurvomyces mirabilis TaxID=574656 RepID=A0AAE0WLS1_9PEZI|nr:hypothetical protein LTR78_006227 [Recurvomyces mirabilis]KAK5152068.1 hypothetical protein LTS14_008843 [Recurvomyces mirabilis]